MIFESSSTTIFPLNHTDSEYKIYIIPDANKMTEQAQNALLKTIEEPPVYAIIILLTENCDSLLPTIRSRCVTLTMNPVEKDKNMHLP